MADLEQKYGAPVEAEPDDRSYEPIPAGWHRLKIVKEEVRDTKAGDGCFLELKVSVVGTKRSFFTKINILNPSEDCMAIGKRQMAALADAAGIPKLKYTEDLVGKEVDGRVEIEPAQGRWPAKNKVGSWAPPGQESGKKDKAPNTVAEEFDEALDGVRSEDKVKAPVTEPAPWEE